MSSIREQGRADAERRDDEEHARRERRYLEALGLVSSWFYRDFYDHHFVPNPEYRPGVFAPESNPRRIVDPARPLPDIAATFRLWEEPADIHSDATFECEGVSYACRWEYHPDGDRAYWDDGWWPRWYVVQSRRRFLLFRRPVLTQVYNAASVARLVG